MFLFIFKYFHNAIYLYFYISKLISEHQLDYSNITKLRGRVIFFASPRSPVTK